LRALDASGRTDKALSALAPEDMARIMFDWQLWARKDQRAPEVPDWTTWLLLGGRGSGKTRAGAEWVRGLAEASPKGPHAARIALVGETMAQVRSVMIEGPSGLLAVHPDASRPRFEPSRRRLTWPGGAIAEMFSATDPDSLRGPQFTAAWADELCKWRHDEATWNMLQFGLRLGTRPRQIVTTTPRPTALLKQLVADRRTQVSRSTTRDNQANLAPGFIETILASYEGTRLGRQEIDGEIIDDNPHALWSRDLLDRARCSEAPAMARIIVGVDPPVTSGPKADACGIVVVGEDGDGMAYVIEDATIKGATPLGWATKVAAAYGRHDADLVVAEVNQGGDMVTTILAQIDPDLPVRKVRATRGKWLRAEPVAAHYERGRVAHVGAWPELEDEMCDFEPGGRSGGKSPDRLDALVWALTELMQGRGHMRIRSL